MSKELIKAEIDKYPALSAIFGTLSKDQQTKLADNISAIFKDTNPAGTIVKEEKPRTQLIIYYPDNLWTNKIHLKVLGSYVGVFMLRDDIDFEKQVRNAALLRGIDITKFEYTEIQKLRTTINDKPAFDDKNSELDINNNESKQSELGQVPIVPDDKSGSNNESSQERTGELFSS